MKADVIIELPATRDAPMRISRVRNGSLEDMSSVAAGSLKSERIVAVAPSVSVGAFRLLLRARRDSDARKEALFAIEDEIAQPVEQVNITLGRRHPETAERDVFIVDAGLMIHWRDSLREIGAAETPIIPEQSLDWPPDCILDLGGRAIVPASPFPFGLDTSLPDETHAAILQAAGAHKLPIRNAGARNMLASLVAQSEPVRLHFPEESRAHQGQASGRNGWNRALALALAVLFIWTAGIWIDAGRTASAADAMEQSAHQRFLALFPGASAPADVHQAVRIRANALDLGAGTFRSLTSTLYDALIETPNARLTTLQFASDDQTLNVTLQATGSPDELGLTSRLATRGLSVETLGVTSAGSMLESRLVVRQLP